MEEKQFYVYVMTTKRNTVLYTGVTSNLLRRVHEHRHKLVEGFTKRYNVVKVVYFEVHASAYSAIEREKQIKGGSRAAKIRIVESLNPDWRDIAEELVVS